MNAIRSRIHTLSKLRTISTTENKSVRSQIAHAKHVSKSQGTKLEEIANKKLPSTVVQEDSKKSKKIWHACKSTHSHRHRNFKFKPSAV